MVQEDIERAVADKWDPANQTITLDQAREAVHAAAASFVEEAGGEALTIGKVWQPKYAVVLTNRRGSRVFVSDDEANCKGLKRVFAGRRLARVWAKRKWNWNSLVFADLTYRDPRPIERIVVNITV